MAKQKRYITNKKQRVVLSDILPFETPATFSNRHFYEFLISNKIELVDDKIKWHSDNIVTKTIIKLLFSIDDSQINQESNSHITLKPNIGALKSIPFQYKISHKQKEFRELTVIHPKNQLAVIEFYDLYRDLILYYSDQSEFSLRRPYKAAQFTYFKDRLHYDKLSADHEMEGVEVFHKEYENLKTFFSYKEISNINKFYESYKYHRCEKKYNNLFKFDISKCFDSIYSHSISWAILEKEIVKENISISNSTFGGKFDRVMQDLNFGETNGIVIGPEFSRIFAELLLQRIDKSVQEELNSLKNPLFFRVDYEVFRYVDDYFIFYNDEVVKDEILKLFRLKLREYKLGFNEQKSEEYSNPILTGITKAKIGIVELLNRHLLFNEFSITENVYNADNSKHSFYISSNNVITNFKIIIENANIKYKDIQNFTLGCIDNKIEDLIKIWIDESNNQKEVADFILNILDLTFFIYTVTPRVNSTIKLCSVISKITQYSKLQLKADLKDRIYKKIYDEIFIVLKKEEIKDHIQIETLYLLVALNGLGKDYRLSEELLSRYLCINLKEKKCDLSLNYFAITVTIFYLGNKTRYKKLKNIIENHILHKITKISQQNRTKHTELVLLFFDLIVCPYVDRVFKNKLFVLFGIPSSQGALRSKIICNRKYWFTKWDNFNFGKELEAKKSQEVY